MPMELCNAYFRKIENTSYVINLTEDANVCPTIKFILGNL